MKTFVYLLLAYWILGRTVRSGYINVIRSVMINIVIFLK